MPIVPTSHRSDRFLRLLCLAGFAWVAHTYAGPPNSCPCSNAHAHAHARMLPLAQQQQFHMPRAHAGQALLHLPQPGTDCHRLHLVFASLCVLAPARCCCRARLGRRNHGRGSVRTHIAQTQGGFSCSLLDACPSCLDLFHARCLTRVRPGSASALHCIVCDAARHEGSARAASARPACPPALNYPRSTCIIPATLSAP